MHEEHNSSQVEQLDTERQAEIGWWQSARVGEMEEWKARKGKETGRYARRKEVAHF